MGLLDFVQRLLPVLQRLVFVDVAARMGLVMVEQKAKAEFVAAADGRKDFVQAEQRILAAVGETEMVVAPSLLQGVQAAMVARMEVVRADLIAAHSELQRRFVPVAVD